jgi:hypothetical protein
MTRIDVGFMLRMAVLHALALVALAVPAHAEWEDYQYEAFDTTETIFPTGTFGEAAYSVDSQGRYIVNGMESSVDSLAAINDSNSFYRVSADCQILSSTAGELAFCGLIFHYGKRPGDDKVSYYVFYVYGDGFYGVKRIINGGKSDVIIPLAQTDLLTAGESNTLAVEARGNKFDLFINGQPVNDFTDMKIDGGGYGLYISKHSIGAFDNFEVKLEPAPLKRQEEVQRSEARGGIKPLNIPRNPDRPLYPWEVGYDKNPKKKKKRIQEKGSGSETRPVDPPKKTVTKPVARKSAAKPTDELKRDSDSRRSNGFIADEKPGPKHKPSVEEPVEALKGTSLRNQYKEVHGEAHAPLESADLTPTDAPVAEPPVAEKVAEPDAVVEESAPVTEAPVDTQAGVEIEDSTVLDDGAALPDSAGHDDILYRRDPKLAEHEETAPGEMPVPEKKKLASADKPEKTKRKRGIRTGSDDWDNGARTVYEPKIRKPKTKEEVKPLEAKPAPAPKEAIASNGDKVLVETVPLDGTPLSDSELENEQLLDTSDSLQDEAEAALPVLPESHEPEATVEENVTAETAETPFPSLDLPEVPSTPEPETEPAPAKQALSFSKPGQVEIADDFTTQQIWKTQELPTSSYRYADGGYAIDNTKAQTMAITFQQDSFADMDLSIDAKHTSGADYVGYGIAARFTVGQDASGRTVISYYGLFISLSGEFMLLKVVDGKETVLKDWGVSPLIELGKVNRVELRIEGSEITALINGREAVHVSDGELSSGGYALLAGPGIAAHFDDLSLTGVRQ